MDVLLLPSLENRKTLAIFDTLKYVLFAFVLLIHPVFVQASLPKGIIQGSTVEGITEYTLANGFKVLLMPDTSKPTVTVNVTYLVGSRHENYGETGMAHLLEHLMFKGTPRHPKLDANFNQRGIRANGTTTLDRTNYFEVFQANDDNLKWVIDMEADRMVNSFIAKKDLDSEMTVVRNEYENGENSPLNVLVKRIQSIAYDWHNYGNPTIGNRSDIENVTMPHLQAFYRTYYQPDNAVLVIAGKFNTEKVLHWVAKAFGSIPKPNRTLPHFWTTEPTQDGERSVTVRRTGDFQIVALAYKVPAALHPDSNGLSYASDILASSPHGPLYKQLVETGKAVAIFNETLGSVEPGLQIFGAIVKKGEPIEPVRDMLIKVIENFAQQAPSQAEMERAKRNIANTLEQIVNDHEKLGVVLSEAIALGDWRYLFKYRDDQNSLTAQQVQAAAAAYFKRDNRTVGVFLPDDAPQRATIPVAPTSREVMKDFQPSAAHRDVATFDPSPANIDKLTQHAQLGGVNLALLPKPSQGEMVTVAISLHFGDEKTLFGKKWIASMTNGMLDKGTTKYSRAELADKMLQLKINGNVHAFTTTKSNLSEALQLVAHILKEPSFPENEFKQWRDLQITQLEAERNNPQQVALRALALHFNRYPKGDIRAHVSLDDDITALKAVTLEDIKTFHREFYGASKAEISIVGDMDTEKTVEQIEHLFAHWKSATSYARLVNHYFDIPPTQQILNTPDKENGFYVAKMNLPLRDDDPDYPALLVANYLFGGGAGLNSRLMERIRQKEGLSYGGGSSLSAGALDRAGNFAIAAISAPQNLLKVDFAAREELDRVLSKGFTETELARAKSGLLQLNAHARSNNSFLASTWNNYLYLGRTFAWFQQLEDTIQGLSLDQVNAAFKKSVDPAKLSTVIVGDKAKMGN